MSRVRSSSDRGVWARHECGNRGVSLTASTLAHSRKAGGSSSVWWLSGGGGGGARHGLVQRQGEHVPRGSLGAWGVGMGVGGQIWYKGKRVDVVGGRLGGGSFEAKPKKKIPWKKLGAGRRVQSDHRKKPRGRLCVKKKKWGKNGSCAKKLSRSRKVDG